MALVVKSANAVYYMCVDVQVQKSYPDKCSKKLSGFSITTTVLFVLLFSIGTIPASAHTSVDIDNMQIDVGWSIEPPVVGIRNDFVFKIIEHGEKENTYTGITSAFKNLEATAMYGGAIKKININSDPRPGYYFSPVIPTKTGSIVIDLKGNINGINVDVQIPIEDVESTAILDFPQRNSQTSDSEVSALKNAISSLQREVSSIKVNSDEGSSIDGNYDLVIFSLSMAVAGVVLAIVAMTRRYNHVALVN
ncbi:hypothetical protein [Nitrosopumilus sp. b2]|uniref:hypothetical protein n=1 Tax=Nitrosopumilus sp. b2 TaxID=2109908 RepID=UPI0031840EF4